MKIPGRIARFRFDVGSETACLTQKGNQHRRKRQTFYIIPLPFFFFFFFSTHSFHNNVPVTWGLVHSNVDLFFVCDTLAESTKFNGGEGIWISGFKPFPFLNQQGFFQRRLFRLLFVSLAFWCGIWLANCRTTSPDSRKYDVCIILYAQVWPC